MKEISGNFISIFNFYWYFSQSKIFILPIIVTKRYNSRQ